MTKLCDVIRNTPFFTIVKFNDIEIQFPLIQGNPDKVLVEYSNGVYKLCKKKSRRNKSKVENDGIAVCSEG